MRIQRFDTLESTNKYCELLDLDTVVEFTVIWALSQTVGIGQRGNRWESYPGQNLTFSIILKPTFLSANRQFLLTEAISLAMVDFLDGLLPDEKISIKWPNDIYVGKKKICGMLISNHLSETVISSSVCGIGLNVNQTEFSDDIPNPTSLALLTGNNYENEPLLEELCACVHRRYEQLQGGIDSENEYLTKLLHKDEQWRYRNEEGEFLATISGVDEYGHLLLTKEDGGRLCCAMKEITMLV